MSILKIGDYDEETELIKWFRFLQANRCSDFNTKEALELDFNQCISLKPFQLVSLACLAEEYYSRGKKIKVFFNLNKKSGRYIHKIGYKHVWRPGTFQDKFLKFIQNSTVPVWKLDRDNLEQFLISTEKFYRNQNLKKNATTPLRVALQETLNNILDHAGTKNGYVISQYYEKSKSLEIVVCDFGEGIPNQINTYLRANNIKLLKQEKALIKALERGFSTKSTPQNRGFGLNTVLSSVEATFGELLIISNKAFLLKQKRKKGVKEETDQLEFSFPGTFIKIKLNANYFQLLDNEQDVEQDLI
ncbi:hypothetical protein BH09BAC5_BH09BAC5_10470 [soil metagenome]